MSPPLPLSLQAWAENKVPMMPPGGDPKDRKVEQKVDGKKKTQAELEQEMAALQYTNPLLLEVCMPPLGPGPSGGLGPPSRSCCWRSRTPH